ncbi:Multidrug resistance protein MdtA precursor [Methylobrevis pamukkalensis]|uniref:Multidrug resistance protein MdtA n=1 Tax=Methylobrevis pamukkalensis TaxID=1439726 RepID=A0A1E3H4L4_9HYPH|nr:efflux RND transporter periplasmic adaptor subunit [Methylobrevis pamukkalensis]ODN71268.1 Multidrug resistance protein MdtA precursor [Methylobrevis pamukkalensis]
MPARARLGGTVVELAVSEGDTVRAGAVIGRILDDKIDFRIAALDAQIGALRSQLANAETELERGRTLLSRGIVSTQRLDELTTAAEVVRNQLAAAEAERQVIVQEAAEGAVLSPADGRVLTVPVTRGAVVLAGETVATIGGGGFFLRLSIPERHASMLTEGATLRIETGHGPAEGRLAKIYPTITSGRVVADVDVPGLDTAFVDARLLVRVPVGERRALVVPVTALVTRSGIDLVMVTTASGTAERAVVVGQRFDHEGEAVAEILTGLQPGMEIVLP